jgi:hypothetical protein
VCSARCWRKEARGPAASEGGLGRLIGVGPGRGIGVLLIGLGLLTFAATAVALAYRPLRRLEDALPDAVIAAPEPQPAA